MREKTCPVCEKKCLVSNDNQSGICRTKGRWERKLVSREGIAKLKAGPIQHQAIPDGLEPAVEWTYRIVGHYLYPTLEQWELGFLRELYIEKEILFWQWAAIAFIHYHKHHNLELRAAEQEKKLLGNFITMQPPDDDADKSYFRELCGEDGYKAEWERTLQLLRAGLAWSPPNGLENPFNDAT